MKTLACACLALIVSSAAAAQTAAEPLPISQLIAAVASKTGKKFVVDPNVQGNATLIGQRPSDLSLADLVTVLHVYGITVFENAGYVRVVPDAMARTLPIPTSSGTEQHADAEMVNRIIKVKSISAAQLIPILRPIVPQYGHLVAYPCTNTLFLVDTYANVRRLESLVERLDTGPDTFQPQSCVQGGTTAKQ